MRNMQSVKGKLQSLKFTYIDAKAHLGFKST